MALRSQTILSSLFRGRSTFRPAPVKEKSSIRQPPTRSPAILIYRDALYLPKTFIPVTDRTGKRRRQPRCCQSPGDTGRASPCLPLPLPPCRSPGTQGRRHGARRSGARASRSPVIRGKTPVGRFRPARRHRGLTATERSRKAATETIEPDRKKVFSGRGRV